MTEQKSAAAGCPYGEAPESRSATSESRSSHGTSPECKSTCGSPECRSTKLGQDQNSAINNDSRGKYLLQTIS